METKITIKVDGEWKDIKTFPQADQNRIKENFQKIWSEQTNRHIKDRIERAKLLEPAAE